MEWPVRKLGDVCKFQNGFAFKSKLFTDKGVPILRISNIQSGSIDLKRIAYTDPKSYKENLDKYRIVDGDLLIAMSGATTGKIGINRTGLIFFLNQRVGKFIPSDYLDKQYLYYYLSTKVEEHLGISAGAAQPNLSTEQIKGIEIPLPPIPEQKRIVAILDQAFADIDKARANAEQNLKNSRELFESYLQQVFSQRGEGWVEMGLKEVSLDFGRGKSKHRPRNDISLYDGDYPFIQTGDVRNCEHLITRHSKTYNDKGLAQSKLWPKGTICITIAANIAETGILDFESCFPDSVIGVVVDPKVTTIRYVEYLLQSFKTILKAKGQGSAQDNINMGTFENMLFPFPSVEKQIEMVRSLDGFMTTVQQLERIYTDKLTAIDELKKSILQKAFAGELTKKAAA